MASIDSAVPIGTQNDRQPSGIDIQVQPMELMKAGATNLTPTLPARDRPAWFLTRVDLYDDAGALAETRDINECIAAITTSRS
jgi:hypothetical protein